MAVSPTDLQKHDFFPVFHCLRSPDKNRLSSARTSIVVIREQFLKKILLNVTDQWNCHVTFCVVFLFDGRWQ